MTPQAGLQGILDKVAARMVADFEASAVVEHRGSKGTVREDAVRAFLADFCRDRRP